MKLLLVTVGGLEEAVAREAEARGLRVLGTPMRSRVLVEGDVDSAASLRTVSAICSLLGIGEIAEEGLRGLRLAVREALRAGGSVEGPVSVRAYVFGRCFPARTVELVASREVRRVMGVETDPSADRTVQVDVDCRRGRVYASLRIVSPASGRRPYYVRRHPRSLNPLIAASVPWLVGVRGDDLLYDPMCGSGTIPIESSLSRGCRCIGSDVNPKYVNAARENARHAHAPVDFFVADAANPPLDPSLVDLAATDPPRSPLSVALRATRAVLRASYGRVALVTPHLSLSIDIARELGYAVEEMWRTFQGGDMVYILVLRRPRQQR